MPENTLQLDGPEWLEADGLGGFASGPVCGPRTRRYHALLLVAVQPPTRRMVLVNGIEAWLEQGNEILPLTTQLYTPDVVQPDGWHHIASFTPTPWPSWIYALPDGTSLRHELFVDPDGGGTVLRWSGDVRGWRLHVRPLLSGRDQHALHTQNRAFQFDATIIGGNVCWRPYDDVPAIAALTNGTYAHAPQWYQRFLYEREQERGLDCQEDLAAPGVFTFELSAGPAVMVLRSGDGILVRAAQYAATLADAEHARRTASSGMSDVVSASYVVDRGDGRTIIAGFPWFTDWGRDSFIALRGLCLATGRIADAKKILLQWAGLVDQGMLPNRFPDDGGAAEYNAVDASLWFIIAVGDLLAASPPDPAAEATLAVASQAILTGYAAGTRYNICMDPADALIAAGQDGVQLTWMDAKCDDWVVTPRIGKPVEVQALWINALRIAARWAQHWSALADRAQASFAARFVRPDGAGLFDVIDADHIAGRTDASVRPNQIFAVGGLPYAVLNAAAARAVVDAVEAALLTPLGLRTLAPDDPAYCPRYAGDRRARDGAYHQGTAWPWLMGPFVQAWLRVRGDTAAARTQAAARFLAPLEDFQAHQGLGHICEVVDGDAPHRPGGCPFQAWSVGEFLRIRRMVAPASPNPT